MNKKIKTLLLSGVISLGILGFNVNKSDAMSYMYTSANLNFRQYAGTYSKKLGTLPKGTKLAVYGSYGNWYSVYANGKWGYVCKDYVVGNKYSQSNNSNKVPVTNTSKGRVLNKLLIVNTYSNYAYYYQNGKLVNYFRCASGKSTSPTPTGNFRITNKIVNPYYSKKDIAGGSSKNPLGCRWLGLGGAYGLHGTNNEYSIGRDVSDGCIRFHKSDIIWIFDNVDIGTHVLITAKNVKNTTIAGWYGYKIY